MASVVVPDGGLILPASHHNAEPVDCPQIMQLELDHGMLHELIKAARPGGRSPQISFGKTMVCQIRELKSEIHSEAQ